MKTRHAAALAVAGWYLLMPPIIDENGVSKVDSGVPISQWSRGDQFTSQSECEEENARLRAIAERHKNWIGPTGSVAAARDRYVFLTNELCVAADDPRLKTR